MYAWFRMKINNEINKYLYGYSLNKIMNWLSNWIVWFRKYIVSICWDKYFYFAFIHEKKINEIKFVLHITMKHVTFNYG